MPWAWLLLALLLLHACSRLAHACKLSAPGGPEEAVGTLQGYLNSIMQAVKEDGANVQAYFAWSLLDNFECAAVSLAREHGSCLLTRLHGRF